MNLNASLKFSFFYALELKSLVHSDNPQILEHLKRSMRQVISNIPVEMLERVSGNYKIGCVGVLKIQEPTCPILFFEVHSKNISEPSFNLKKKVSRYEGQFPFYDFLKKVSYYGTPCTTNPVKTYSTSSKETNFSKALSSYPKCINI